MAEKSPPVRRAILNSSGEAAFPIFLEGVRNGSVNKAACDPFQEDVLTRTPVFMLT
jgi:hypothetical protein